MVKFSKARPKSWNGSLFNWTLSPIAAGATNYGLIIDPAEADPDGGSWSGYQEPTIARIIGQFSVAAVGGTTPGDPATGAAGIIVVDELAAAGLQSAPLSPITDVNADWMWWWTWSVVTDETGSGISINRCNVDVRSARRVDAATRKGLLLSVTNGVNSTATVIWSAGFRALLVG